LANIAAKLHMAGLAPATLGYWEKHWVLGLFASGQPKKPSKAVTIVCVSSNVFAEKFVNVNAA